MDQKRRLVSGTRRAVAVRAASGKEVGERRFGGSLGGSCVRAGRGGGWRAVRRGLVGVADEGYEDVGDGGGADVAERGELLAGDAVVEEDAAAEGLAFLNGLEGAGGG